MKDSVIKIPSSGDENDYVLIRASQSATKPHNLVLIGSEGENVYTATVSSTDNFSCINWRDGVQPHYTIVENILSSIFLDEIVDTDSPKFRARGVGKEIARAGYQAISAIKSDTLVITIQKEVESIVENLGDITLHPEELEISLFDWCSIIIDSKKRLLHEFEEFRSCLEERKEEADKLRKALEALVDLKKAHEKELLQKFALLLNEKKARIREQQRCLSSESVNNYAKPGEIQEATPTDVGLVLDMPEASQPLKRPKRNASKSHTTDNETNTGNSWEINAVEDHVPHNETDKDTNITPTISETETETDDEDLRLISENKSKKIPRSLSKPIQESKALLANDEIVILPPRRQLPFARKMARASKAKIAAKNQQPESDDEL